jgi:hypothetical protein
MADEFFSRLGSAARWLLVAFCAGLALGVRVEGSEHLLFQSLINLDCKAQYRIALSLYLQEDAGTWQAFEVRSLIETTDPQVKELPSRIESTRTLAFSELVALGETGFALLAVPGTNLEVLYLKALDPRNPERTLGLSYPVDARPGIRQWGWLPLSIVKEGSVFHLVDTEGAPYGWIEMEVRYQWGRKPVGLCTFRPCSR